MKAVLCPVCQGRGWINKSTRRGQTSGAWTEKCHGCGGKGWVEIHEETIWPSRNINYNCPVCGGDRNGPPLTGCPPGGHYGTY